MCSFENNQAVMSQKEQEEALSLLAVPVIEMSKDEIESGDQTRLLKLQEEEDKKEFEFGSWRADSLQNEPIMCAAEDVFFQGQILPLRPVSSDCVMAGIRQDSRWVSRSESMDHFYGFTSSRSRYTHKAKELEWNHFHAHPSPRPQIWQTTARPGNGGSRSRRSTIWGFFRLGLLQTPEIELQDLKLKLLNRDKSCGGSSNGSSSRNSNSRGEGETKLKKMVNRVKVFDGFSGCKCSVSTAETIPSGIAIIKKLSGTGRKKETKEEQQTKQGKQAMAHRRTFEWLKQLSLPEADLPWEAWILQ